MSSPSSSDAVATIEGFSREQLDAIALTSQQRALASRDAFQREIVPIKTRDGDVVVDEHPRALQIGDLLAGLGMRHLAEEHHGHLRVLHDHRSEVCGNELFAAGRAGKLGHGQAVGGSEGRSATRSSWCRRRRRSSICGVARRI